MVSVAFRTNLEVSSCIQEASKSICPYLERSLVQKFMKSPLPMLKGWVFKPNEILSRYFIYIEIDFNAIICDYQTALLTTEQQAVETKCVPF